MQITKDNWQQMKGVEFTAIAGREVFKDCVLICGFTNDEEWPEAAITIKNLNDPDPNGFVYCWVIPLPNWEFLFHSTLSTIRHLVNNGAGVCIETVHSIFTEALRAEGVGEDGGIFRGCPL